MKKRLAGKTTHFVLMHNVDFLIILNVRFICYILYIKQLLNDVEQDNLQLFAEGETIIGGYSPRRSRGKHIHHNHWASPSLVDIHHNHSGFALINYHLIEISSS